MTRINAYHRGQKLYYLLYSYIPFEVKDSVNITCINKNGYITQYNSYITRFWKILEKKSTIHYKQNYIVRKLSSDVSINIYVHVRTSSYLMILNQYLCIMYTYIIIFRLIRCFYFMTILQNAHFFAPKSIISQNVLLILEIVTYLIYLL